MLLLTCVSCRVAPQPPPAPRVLVTPPAPAAIVEPTAPQKPKPGDPLLRTGDEILVCGQLIHTGSRVVLWTDPGGYDAYRLEPRFPNPNTEPKEKPAKACFGMRPLDFLDAAGKTRVAERGWDLPELRETVQQIVIHYDAIGSARDCFRVLHDVRGLSSHFLLDLDGTIYQTLDLKEMAWHAGKANGRSIGIEIANVGAYENLPELEALSDRAPLAIRSAGPVQGTIRDRSLWQYRFTDAQYESLIHLAATLTRAFPRLQVGTPETLEQVSTGRVFSEETLPSYRGLLGHLHVSEEKADPGPAFDWDRLLRGISQALP